MNPILGGLLGGLAKVALTAKCGCCGSELIGFWHKLPHGCYVCGPCINKAEGAGTWKVRCAACKKLWRDL